MLLLLACEPVPNKGPDFTVPQVVSGYDAEARDLAPDYESVSFETVHGDMLDLLPEAPCNVLDVGAGSGRDAAWFAANGYSVVAVEPSSEMRAAAKEAHKDADITWFNAQLPALEQVIRSKLTFDLIWLSAVWMHVPPNDRRRAFRKLVSVMSPGASMMVSLRQGPPIPTRPMHQVRSDEIEKLAHQFGLQVVRNRKRDDARGRADVRWEVVWLRLPDDGTNALPLLRHVVFTDRKSATYKLALLRVLVRIADSASGLSRESQDGTHVQIPLGLVALYWIRTFWPLVERKIPQLPGTTNMSFVKEGFKALMSKDSIHSLRVGETMQGERATNLIKAMRDTAGSILSMPTTFTTYPGSDDQVFKGERYTKRLFDRVRIDEEFLWSFGTYSIPANLWRAMSRYAVWIEPAILTEWTQVMLSFQKDNPTPLEDHQLALRWLEPLHDTSFVRQRVKSLHESGKKLHCVWSGDQLKQTFAIDHCLPFAAWPCNDLWNLLPSSAKANNTKSDRLPSPAALESAKPRILDWWDAAYLQHEPLARRFTDESLSALPSIAAENKPVTAESVFEGLMVQQMVLKRDQQLEEWTP